MEKWKQTLLPILIMLAFSAGLNHPNDMVDHYQMCEYYKDEYKCTQVALHPDGDYDYPNAVFEWSIDIPKKNLFSAIYTVVAVDDHGYRSAENCEVDYDPTDKTDNCWACWEQQECIDTYLKPPKLKPRLEGP